MKPSTPAAAGNAAVYTLLLAVAVLPSLLLGQDAYVLIHDNLDSEFVYLTNLVRTGTAFAYGTDATLPNVMDGLPRSALRSGLNVSVWLFALLPPLAAYMANALLVRSVAFLGMLLLLGRRVFAPGEGQAIGRWLALLFALLPFYSLYGLSVAGLPLLLYAFSNIVEREARWWDWLTVAAFPLFSLLYMGGIPAVAALGAYAAYRAARLRRLEPHVAVPILVLAAGYLLVEWPMIRSAFFDDAWTTHRVEMAPSGSFADVRRDAWLLLTEGHYHAATMPTLPLLVALALAAAPLRRSDDGSKVGRLLLVTGAIIAFAALYDPLLVRSLGAVLPLLGQVQLDRLYFLLPPCWIVLFAFALRALASRPVLRRLVPALIAVQAIAILRTSGEVRNNLALLAGRKLEPTFADVLAPDLFAIVRDAIGRPPSQYRVVGVGLHPSVLQYNGFHTLDGYQNHYPLAYKHRFRRVIAPELDKSPALARYFDDWGSRAYVFSLELGRSYLWPKDSGKEIANLGIDVQALRELGAGYVLSSVPIGNHEALSLELLGTYETAKSYGRIHLYRVPS